MKDTSAAKKSTPADKAKANKPKTARKITQSYLENAGKFYLEKFPASIQHFRLVMGRKIYKSCQAHPDQSAQDCQKLLDAVVDKFARLGFLDDAALSKGLLYSYQQRGWSQRKIRATLAQKGLPADLIAEGMAAQEDASDLNAAVLFTRKKRLASFATGEPRPDKWLAALGRAGFDYETARRALSLSRDEAEEILSKLN